MDSLGVYVSVPFCRAKCSFCNFASGVSSAGQVEAYVGTLCAEIGTAAETASRLGAVLPRAVDSVYFGGGTPSLLSPAQLRRIFRTLQQSFEVSAAAEITMEAAPGQISGEVLAEAMRLGVNRVSLGVQSFVDGESAAVGRTHTGASCLEEVRRLREAGLQEVALDLIAGLPYQTAESWQRSLEAAANSGATHVSVYMLEVDEDSRLGREVMSGGLRLHAPRVPGEDVSACLYEQACEWLEARGFPLYEISNFAAAQHESRHNRKYWERKPYMGFGLDAHSMVEARDTGTRNEGPQAVRFANADELPAYEEASWGGEVVRVGLDEAFEECVFLGLRLRAGVCVAELTDRFGAARVAACDDEVRDLTLGGLMVAEDGRWRLTARGRMVSSEVFGRLLAGVAV